MNAITHTGHRRRTVTDCDTYRRRLHVDYGYRLGLGDSCRVIDGSSAPDWPKSTLAILVLPLVEWTGCRAGVQAIVASKTEVLELRGMYWLRRLQSLLLQRHKGPFCLITGTTMTALAKTQKPLMSVCNSNHLLRKNINIVTMPTHDVLLCHFRKT